jgi:Mn-dependent DtxR family transcriptional regulator
MALMLQNKTQLEVAKALRIKQPSVHQRLKAGGWVIIQSVVNRFQQIQQ